MPNNLHHHVFPVLDALISEAINDLAIEEITPSCKKGCHHCCYLLVEISMEEAQALASWIHNQPLAIKNRVINRVKENAADARELFRHSKHSQAHVDPVDINAEISDECYDAYFYGKERACPFLENNACQAYEARPSACRLHLVTSDPTLCQRDVTDDTGYEVPERIEELRNEFAPINTAVSKDGRWGHLGILVETALGEMEQP